MEILKRKIILLVLFCWGSFLLVHAQPSLKTTIDKNEILIGEQIKFEVEAHFPKQDFFVKWIALPDTLQHFEVVDKSKVDSVFTNQKLTGLSQTFTLTSFDSGKWVLPAFDIDFNPASGDTTFNLYTDSFPVTVSFQADTTNIIRDIKTIRAVKDDIPMWYWIAGAAALILFILIAAWLYRRYKTGKKLLPSRSSMSAYQQAIIELEKLKQLNLSVPAEIKIYHTQLADILKQYLSLKKGTDYGSITTSDILILINENGMDKDGLSKAAAALRCSNAVKFAKYLPVQKESEESLQSIKEVINFTEQSTVNNKP